MRRIIVTSLALLLVAGVPACSYWKEFTNLFEDDVNGPGGVNDLVASIERVYVDSELSKEKAHKAHRALETITNAQFKGDAVSAYAQFMRATEESEQQAEKLGGSVEAMQDVAEPVFERWAFDLKAIGSAELRQRSRMRMMETRERYDAIVIAVEPAQASLGTVNKSLRDHALFLGNDMNPAALAALRQDVAALGELLVDLDRKFDASLQAARAYVDSAGLPAGVVAADMPPAERRQPVAEDVEAVKVRGTAEND